jgi:3-methyladenine DNA glycosylase/8-oxoguanine DNA glycosylase
MVRWAMENEVKPITVDHAEAAGYRPWRSYAIINLWNSIAPKNNKEIQS